MKLTFILHMTRYWKNQNRGIPNVESNLDFLLAFLAHEAREISLLEYLGREEEDCASISKFKLVFKPRKRIETFADYRTVFLTKLTQFEEPENALCNLQLKIISVEFTPKEWRIFAAIKVLIDKLKVKTTP